MSVICVEAIIYSLLYNLHDCTFKAQRHLSQMKGCSKGFEESSKVLRVQNLYTIKASKLQVDGSNSQYNELIKSGESGPKLTLGQPNKL